MRALRELKVTGGGGNVRSFGISLAGASEYESILTYLIFPLSSQTESFSGSGISTAVPELERRYCGTSKARMPRTNLILGQEAACKAVSVIRVPWPLQASILCRIGIVSHQTNSLGCGTVPRHTTYPLQI